jgi:cytidyltransferase-like protein
MKVLVFGSFDIIHKGHEFLLQKAAEYGELHVVIARDETITKLKVNLHTIHKNKDENTYVNFQWYKTHTSAILVTNTKS